MAGISKVILNTTDRDGKVVTRQYKTTKRAAIYRYDTLREVMVDTKEYMPKGNIITTKDYRLHDRTNGSIYYRNYVDTLDETKRKYISSEDLEYVGERKLDPVKGMTTVPPANKTVVTSSNTTTIESTSTSTTSTTSTGVTGSLQAYEEVPVTIGFTHDANNSMAHVADSVILNGRGIHGMPYQFMEIADRRIIGVDKNNKTKISSFGRKFTERIVSRMPLLLITPGEPNYLSGFSAKTKSNLIQKLNNLGLNGSVDDEPSLAEMLSSETGVGRYFTLDFAYKQYYQYVNAMLRQAAIYLNIQGRTFPEKNGVHKPLWKYDWSYHTNSYLPGVLTSNEYVAFYVESETSISESFTNNTTPSMLASKLEQGSELANELKFIMGSYGAKIDMGGLDDGTVSGISEKFDKVISSTPLTNNRLIKRLYGDVQTIVSGGKIIFPEIWSDSNFSRNYSIDIKLRTPDCDPFSWYINIFVPLAHLICLAAPRQVVANSKTNPNAYSAPFLIRCFYKGIFSIEMGIIDNMTINKGNKSAWTVDGLPTEVDVNISLKDLYDVMAINRYIGRSSWALMKNTAMTDYIATSCGCNINKIDIERMVDLWAIQKYNVVGDIPRQAWMGITQDLASSLSTFFRDGKITF